MRLWVVLVALVGLSSLSSPALAHDDPIVTVRVMCDGFNALDMDAVLGELSDSAALTVDRPVQGRDQIQAWVKEEFDDDLRIQIVDIGTPQRLADGYTLSWTARFSRQDWRKVGIQARRVVNQTVIHNGRITEWTATMDTGTDAPAAAPAPADLNTISSAESSSSMPEVFGVPITLVLAGVLALSGAGLALRSVLRR